ncbi:Kinase-like protein [Mycena venus]|uniref:Kinase-like protein n=1 Tax=Mycena venus TaxID=2733690 RepID=A0A8H7D9G7_9AGAR|nr:Kinase-like protein [Mycena venus]
MSPERLCGSASKKPSDIYAFGMTIYELFTNDTPLGHVPPQDLRSLVVHDGLRPDRLGEDDQPVMPEDAWDLTVQLWTTGAPDRPTSGRLYDLLMQLQDSTSSESISLPLSPSSSNDAQTPQKRHLMLMTVLKNSQMPSHCLAFSPNGRYLATALLDGTVWIWEVLSGNPIFNFIAQHHGKPLPHSSHLRWEVLSIAFAPDGQRIATAGRVVQVWDLITRERSLPALTNHTSAVWCVAFSSDGRFLASGSEDHTAIIWHADTGTIHATLAQHVHLVRAVQFSPDSALVATGAWDKTVRIWEVSTGACVHVLRDHTAVVSTELSALGTYAGGAQRDAPWTGSARLMQSLSYSPNGKWIITGDWDSTVQLLDVRTGRVVGELALTPRTHIFCVAFSPDGRAVAVASEQPKILMFSEPGQFN